MAGLLNYDSLFEFLQLKFQKCNPAGGESSEQNQDTNDHSIPFSLTMQELNVILASLPRRESHENNLPNQERESQEHNQPNQERESHENNQLNQEKGSHENNQSNQEREEWDKIKEVSSGGRIH